MRTRSLLLALLIPLGFALTSPALAETCLAPIRPYVPTDPEAAQEYADIIRKDFEAYIGDIESYFHCLEAERGRAFEEAREVSQEYGTFLRGLGED